MALPPFDLTDRGVKFAALGGDEWIELSWSDVTKLEAVDPYPAFVLHTAELRQPFTPGGDDEREFVARTADLFGRASAAGVALDRGWLAHDPVEWEPVDALPDESAGDDGYRAEPREVVVARRGAPSSSEALLMWLLKQKRDLHGHRRLVLTTEHVYAERFDESVWRIPRRALRRTRRTRSGDLVCTFGRSTRLVITGRAGCPVAEALEAQVSDE